MNDNELRVWGAKWCPCTTNLQSLRWLYEYPMRVRKFQDALWEQLYSQKGTAR